MKYIVAIIIFKREACKFIWYAFYMTWNFQKWRATETEIIIVLNNLLSVT
jgi:hypothetical protein